VFNIQVYVKHAGMKIQLTTLPVDFIMHEYLHKYFEQQQQQPFIKK